MLVIKISNNDKLKQTNIKYFFSSKDIIKSKKEGKVGEKHSSHVKVNIGSYSECTKKNGQETLHQRQGGRHMQTSRKPRKRCSDFSLWNGGNVM